MNTGTVVIVVHEAELRNSLAETLRGQGRTVVTLPQGEGLARHLTSRDTQAVIVGEDLEDAAPALLLKKALDRGSTFVVRVGRINDDCLLGRLESDGTEEVARTAADLGGWIEDRLRAWEDAGGQAAETQAGGGQVSGGQVSGGQVSGGQVSGGQGTDPLMARDGEREVRICASTPEMRRVLSMVDVVAPTESTVLLSGESGTGKDLFARLTHQRSRRSSLPLVEVHCGAIPPSLMESELFGHEKGAFTGAHHKKEGLCLAAHGGTLFLDEIGELPLDMQVKLLRVLQSGWLRPVGATHSERVDLRVIAATNRDLKDEVLAGRFRLDLFYRLNVISIPIPPLRERLQDLPELIEFVMDGLASRGIKPTRFSPEVMRVLAGYTWPGNVRELENIVERLVLLFPDGNVDLSELRTMLCDVRGRDLALEAEPEANLASPGTELSLYSEDLTLRELEDLHIRRVLGRCEGNKTRAAQALGINVKTLYNKMKAAGLRKEDFALDQ